MGRPIADKFSSAKRRLARAKEHIADVKSRVGSFFKTKPYASSVERNAEGLNEHKVKLTVPMPDKITDITYEAIEALRSSLDQATYAVAVACNAKRPDLVHFPVADTAAQFEDSLNGRVKDFPADILALFRTLKPYEAGNGTIWALNRIRRQGYHRLVVPIGTGSAGMRIGVLRASALTSLDINAPRWDSEKDEMIFAIAGYGSQFDYNVNLSFYIAFGPVEGVPGQPVIETLNAMAGEVERIVGLIESESRRIGLIA